MVDLTLCFFDQLDGKLLAAFGAASFENIPSALGAHAGSKAVDSLTASLLWLPRAFRHMVSPQYFKSTPAGRMMMT
jgi:hypothetical protein